MTTMAEVGIFSVITFFVFVQGLPQYSRSETLHFDENHKTALTRNKRECRNRCSSQSPAVYRVEKTAIASSSIKRRPSVPQLQLYENKHNPPVYIPPPLYAPPPSPTRKIIHIKRPASANQQCTTCSMPSQPPQIIQTLQPAPPTKIVQTLPPAQPVAFPMAYVPTQEMQFIPPSVPQPIISTYLSPLPQAQPQPIISTYSLPIPQAQPVTYSSAAPVRTYGTPIQVQSFPAYLATAPDTRFTSLPLTQEASYTSQRYPAIQVESS